MKSIIMSLIALAVLMVFAVATVQADENGEGKEEEKEYQSTCPVMGGEINKELYVDHKGKRIYVCCKGCVGKVEADPEKYIKKIDENGQKVYHTPKKCPGCKGKDGVCPHMGKKDMHGKHHEKGDKSEDGKKAVGCCGCGMR